MNSETHPWFELASRYCEEAVKKSPSSASRVWEARGLVMEYVWESMRTHDEVSPPFLRNPEKSNFVRARKVMQIRYSETSRADGHLIPEENGFSMLLRSGLVPLRERTVIAHELGHTFFYDLSREPPTPFFHSNFSWRQIEGPAYEIARQILIPAKWLSGASRAPGIGAFLDLQTMFQVSREVLARRLIHDLRLWDVMLIFSFETSFPSDRPSTNTRVFRGPSFKHLDVRGLFRNVENVEAEHVPESYSKVTSVGKRKLSVETVRSRGDGSNVCLVAPA